MYFVKLTIKKKGKVTNIITSEELESYEKANELLERTLKRATNYTDIKFLGNGKVKVIKFNEEDILEILEK